MFQCREIILENTIGLKSSLPLTFRIEGNESSKTYLDCQLGGLKDSQKDLNITLNTAGDIKLLLYHDNR